MRASSCGATSASSALMIKSSQEPHTSKRQLPLNVGITARPRRGLIVRNAAIDGIGSRYRRLQEHPVRIRRPKVRQVRPHGGSDDLPAITAQMSYTMYSLTTSINRIGHRGTAV
jgi:hypothetical protein